MNIQVHARYTGHTGPVYSVCEGPGAGTFLSGSGDGRVVLWDLDRPDQGELLVNVGRPVFCLWSDAPADRLYIGTDIGSLHVIDLHGRKEVQVLRDQLKGLYAILPLGKDLLCCAGGDGTLTVYRKGPALTLHRRIPLCPDKLRGLATDATGTLLAVACGDGTVRLLETTWFNELATLAGHEGGALCAAFHPGKPALLTGGKDGHIRSWRTSDDHAQLLALPAHKAAIYRIAFDPAGTLLATGGRDKMAKLWDAGTLEPIARLDRAAGGHAHSVNGLCWSGTTLLTAGDDRTIVAWR